MGRGSRTLVAGRVSRPSYRDPPTGILPLWAQCKYIAPLKSHFGVWRGVKVIVGLLRGERGWAVGPALVEVRVIILAGIG